MNDVAKNGALIAQEIFGSFFLAESEFALPVSCVQEVVRAPAAYTALPLSPKYLKGLFNLRGTVIPVIDLRDLLQLSLSAPSDAQRIAVIEIEGACVGILFDKTGEIFRNDEEERSDFDMVAGSGVVSGVFKKDGGRRIVQILDCKGIFKLQNVPKDAARSRLGRDSISRKRGAKRQCISFVVGPSRCAMPISDIQEILKVERLNESALGVGNCIGIIDLRGTTVPIVDFASLLKYRDVDRSEASTRGDRRIVVMRLGEELFGLLVDAVDSIVSYFSDELIAFPMVEQGRGEMFLGCIKSHDGEDVLLLDYQKILDAAEIAEMTHGHSKIYRRKTADKAEKGAAGGSRRTYITFKVDESYAISIDDVKEIIDFSEGLLQPPGLKKHVRGILNLRGVLVTIVDARRMYSPGKDAPPDDVGAQKVLVFQKNGAHFGLVVDSVDSIIALSDGDKIRMPDLLHKQAEGSLSADVLEAAQLADASGAKRSVLILSADAIAARVMKSLAA